MKKSYLGLFGGILFLSLCFAACGGDDNGGISGDATSLIVGSWQSTNVYSYSIYDGEKTNEEDEEYTTETFIFNEGGTGIFSDTDSKNRDYYTFTWKVSGNKLILDEGTDEEEEYTITTLNSTTLVLVIEYDEEDGEGGYYGRGTYERTSSLNSEEDETEATTGKGTVKITKAEAVRKTTTGLQINVTLTTSGVTADEVKSLKVIGGTSSDADGSLYGSVGSGNTSGTCTISAGLKSNTTYYLKGVLTTSSGTVYSSVKSVTTPD